MDIVERLLSGEDGLEYAAAEEIERLRAQVAALREALEEISQAVGDPSAYWIARAALEDK